MRRFTIQELISSERSNNFTLLRLLAALAVLFGHSFALSLGRGHHDPISSYTIKVWGEGIGSIAVDLFFVISGFLIAASYIHRQNIIAFAEARVLRIFPALAVAVFFCVFVVGAYVTTLPLGEYLHHKLTWAYIWHNISLLQGIVFKLPGVFEEMPFKYGINGSLWTLPYEVWMYVFTGLCGILGILNHRTVFNAFFLIIIITFLLHPEGLLILEKSHHMQIVQLFIYGMFFYVNREQISLSWIALIVLAILYAATSGAIYNQQIKQLLFAYAVFFIALHPSLRLPPLDRIGDFSYGVYIYAFPVQQLIVYSIEGIAPYSLFFLALPPVLVLSVASWFLIEKPALSLKGRLRYGKRWADPRAEVGDKRVAK